VAGHHAHALELLAGEQVRFVDGEDDVAVALVGLGGERGLDLRDEGRVVETGCLPECQGDGPVDSPVILSFRVIRGCDLRRPVVDSVADETLEA